MIRKIVFFALGGLVSVRIVAGPAGPLDNPFHMEGKPRPGLDQQTQKRLEACALDYQAVLCGKKPVHAQPDPDRELTDADQFYKGDGYKLHILKNPVTLDGVRGFIYGPMIDLEPEVVEGEMRSVLRTSFYTVEEMKKADPAPAAFHSGTGKDKPAWGAKMQGRLQACQADYQAVIEGKKPIYAKPASTNETHFFKGEGYSIDIIEEPAIIGGVAGFFYGPMLDLDAPNSEELGAILHVTFYPDDQMKKLLERK